jgi:hypothetical protein
MPDALPATLLSSKLMSQGFRRGFTQGTAVTCLARFVSLISKYVLAKSAECSERLKTSRSIATLKDLDSRVYVTRNELATFASPGNGDEELILHEKPPV